MFGFIYLSVVHTLDFILAFSDLKVIWRFELGKIIIVEVVLFYVQEGWFLYATYSFLMISRGGRSANR
jgi:hypothetical protein